MILALSLLICLVSSCVAVKVTFSTSGSLATSSSFGSFGTLVSQQTCSNLRPGQCCQVRSLDPHVGTLFSSQAPQYREAEFAALETLDIAAVWQPSGHLSGCSGVPVATRPGPGDWKYSPTRGGGVQISGASYIKLTPGHPRDSDAPWMEAEGILGFVTGKDKWVSSKASSSVANRVNGLFRSMTLGGARKRRVLRRDIIGGERGQVFVQPPTKARAIWPDVIVINGTNYREEAPGSPVYKDRDGKTLDLTEPG